MRRTQLLLAPMLLSLAASLAACQIDSDEFREGDNLERTQQHAIGSIPAIGQPHYEAVAAITILLPPSSVGGPRPDSRYCTGVLIEDRTVMTSSECLARNLAAQDDPEHNGADYLGADSIQVQFGSSISAATEYTLDATFDTAPNATKGVVVHRYFEDQPQNNIALLRLAESPGITPAAIRTEPIGDELVGQTIEFVGYGKQDGAGGGEDTFTGRNIVTPTIREISGTRVKAGDDELTTCFADSGGPGFVDFGGEVGVQVVSISERHAECDADVNRTRVDIYADEFLVPFITFVSGGCPGDDCGACDFDGTCTEDCPTRDWDCDLGSLPGTGCSIDGDCEEGGACVPATDDPSFSYCDKPCDPAEPTSCPSGMTCNDSNRCIWSGISPGSQGATCTSPADCRSGFCEDTVCAFECDANDGNACDQANGFFCLTATDDPSVTVCRLELREGGGGFCHASSSPHMHDGERNSLLAGLGLVFVLGLVRRRRHSR